MTGNQKNSVDKTSLLLAGGLAVLVLLLAGILGWRGMLQANGIIGMVAVAVGGFVAVALKDRWKRILGGGGDEGEG